MVILISASGMAKIIMFCLQQLVHATERRILKTMSIFVEATPAPAAQTKNASQVALFLAGILVVMAVGQLFGFEKFIPLIESFKLPGGHGTATLVAGSIVASEVFALPFLLRMHLSPLMRFVSMILGWFVAILWCGVSLWLVTQGVSGNSGFLGTTVKLPVGLWTVCFSLALAVLSGWASWGMWPLRAKR